MCPTAAAAAAAPGLMLYWISTEGISQRSNHTTPCSVSETSYSASTGAATACINTCVLEKSLVVYEDDTSRMAATDHPLKQLVGTFPRDFAVWLLGVTIHDIHPVHVELPAEVIAADLVFLVTLAESRTIVLHIEFQGRRSHEPMEWRMLDYMTRLAHT